MLHHIIRGRLSLVRKPTNGSMDALCACMRVAMLALILMFRCGELTYSLGMVQEAGRWAGRHLYFGVFSEIIDYC